jgi:hypothetical protein
MPVGGAVQDVGSRRSATRIPEPEAGVTVNLQNPQPVIASVSPNPANPGSATIMIDGTGFAKGATVYFAGAALATTFGSPREFVKTFKYRGSNEMAFLGILGG